MKNVPNLLLIGVPRCASTALAVAMGKHPDIHVCNPKEPHFLAFGESGRRLNGVGAEAFGPDRIYSREKWEKLFRNQHARYRVDASVSTISYPETSIANIRKYCDPDSRLIAILRNPVERAFSSYMYCVSRGWDAGTFEQCLEEEDQRRAEGWQHLWFLRYLSDYQHRLQPFLDAFPEENIHIAITEEFSTRPADVLSDLFSFLDLPNIEIDDADSRVNSSGVSNSLLVRDMVGFVRNRPWLRDALRTIVPHKFREFVKSSNITRVEMDGETREMLQESLDGTRNWVQQLIGRQLPCWK